MVADETFDSSQSEMSWCNITPLPYWFHTVIHQDQHFPVPNVLRTKTKPLNDNLKADFGR